METLSERRKHKRLKAQTDAFAILSPHPVQLGQIIDISNGGLSFQYIESDNITDSFEELSILVTETVFSIEKLPVETISNFPMPNDFPISTIIMKRCSLKFQDLSPDQTIQLENFIQNHTR